MYTDAVVLAGIATVLLMLGFFVAIGVFVVKDAKHQLGEHGRQSEAPVKAGENGTR